MILFSEKPNVLLIVADDLGFSDIGCYGGNISTPVIDGLSKESQHQILCATYLFTWKSSLLTGCDNHFAGLGIMHEMDYPELHKLNLPEYAGSLRNDLITLPEILNKNGYHTYMVGKWHLGEGVGQNPYERGFGKLLYLEQVEEVIRDQRPISTATIYDLYSKWESSKIAGISILELCRFNYKITLIVTRMIRSPFLRFNPLQLCMTHCRLHKIILIKIQRQIRLWLGCF